MAVVHVLVSPNGGRGRARAASSVVKSVIEDAGHTAVDLSGDSARASVAAAKQAVAGGAQRLVAVGGDGTLHLALQAVAGTDTVLGLVPAGTGNDFARAMGLFEAPVEQATQQALGVARPLDVIESGGAWVASTVTAGFSVDVNNTADAMRFPRGPSRYTVATLLTVPRLRHRRLRFLVDGQRHEFTSALWAVANTPSFGGGMAICPDANPADGLLNLTVVGDAGRITLLRLLPTVFTGAHVHHPKVHTLQGETITVTEIGGEGAPAASELRGDGEPIGETPVTLTAVPAAVNFAAGA